jgi:hypothetical protein
MTIGKRTIQMMTAASSAAWRLGSVVAGGNQISARENVGEVGATLMPNTKR